MKNTSECTKCKSKDVVRIPGTMRGLVFGNNIQIGWTAWNQLLVTRYVCCACGFSEEWIDSSQDRYKIQEKYGNSK